MSSAQAHPSESIRLSYILEKHEKVEEIRIREAIEKLKRNKLAEEYQKLPKSEISQNRFIRCAATSKTMPNCPSIIIINAMNRNEAGFVTHANNKRFSIQNVAVTAELSWEYGVQ